MTFGIQSACGNKYKCALACALALALARTLTLAFAKTVTTNALPDCNQLGNVRLRIVPKQWPLS